jgi:hypothetical protein
MPVPRQDRGRALGFEVKACYVDNEKGYRFSMTTTVAAPPSWEHILETGRAIQTDRAAALARLGELFRAGTPPADLDGPTEGALVGFVIQPVFDRATAALASRWVPWAGKRFDAAASRGDNLLPRSARWPSKLLWPTYRLRDAGDRLSGFDFQTRVERGALDPDTDVLVIDYSVIASNPRLAIRRIRDELVEVAPGTHLGKMLWRHRDGRHSQLGYFALRETPPR